MTVSQNFETSEYIIIFITKLTQRSTDKHLAQYNVSSEINILARNMTDSKLVSLTKGIIIKSRQTIYILSININNP